MIHARAASRIVSSGHNSHTGETVIAEGELVLDGGGSITDTSRVLIEDTGTLSLLDGELITLRLDIRRGGEFNFDGGILSVAGIRGDLLNRGGTFAPGRAPALSVVRGDYTQTAGVLELEVRGSGRIGDVDRLMVLGTLSAGGTLRIVSDGYVPVCGQTFMLAAAFSIDGRFDIESPKTPDGEDIFSVRIRRGVVLAKVRRSACE